MWPKVPSILTILKLQWIQRWAFNAGPYPTHLQTLLTVCDKIWRIGLGLQGYKARLSPSHSGPENKAKLSHRPINGAQIQTIWAGLRFAQPVNTPRDCWRLEAREKGLKGGWVGVGKLTSVGIEKCLILKVVNACYTLGHVCAIQIHGIPSKQCLPPYVENGFPLGLTIDGK